MSGPDRLDDRPAPIDDQPYPRVTIGLFRHPYIPGDQLDPECGYVWREHGSIDLGNFGYTVCPGGPWQPPGKPRQPPGQLLGEALVDLLVRHGLPEDAHVLNVWADPQGVRVEIATGPFQSVEHRLDPAHYA